MSGEVITWEMEASGHGGQLSQRRTEDKKKIHLLELVLAVSLELLWNVE